MASLRSTARIARPADEVWKIVADVVGISACFPGIDHATAVDGKHSCKLAGGQELHEDVVNLDHDLRRFQHTITSGMPVQHHLGTVDVVEDGPDGALGAYSTEITPDSVAEVMGRSIEGGVQGLKAHLEDGR